MTCLTSLMPRLPHRDRLHPQTVSQSKASLPLSGPQDQQLVQPLFLVPLEVLTWRGFLSKFPPSKTTNSQILNGVNRPLRSVSLTLVPDAKLQLRVWSPNLTLPQSNPSPRHWDTTSLHIHSHPRRCTKSPWLHTFSQVLRSQLCVLNVPCSHSPSLCSTYQSLAGEF